MTAIEELHEFKFLTINTPTLWRKGTVEKDNTMEFDDERGGIALASSEVFSLTREFRIPIENPLDLALDNHCAVFYIIDKDTKRLLFYDLNSGNWDWISCIAFSDPRAIAVGDKDLYVIDGRSIVVLAKINYQVRRVIGPIGTNPQTFALDENENLFVLDPLEGKFNVFRILSNNGEISLLLTAGTSISDATAISIGKSDGKIYVLDIGEREFHVFSDTGLPDGHIALDQESLHRDPSGLVAISKDGVYTGDKGVGVDYYPHPRKYSYSHQSQPLEYNRPTHKIILNRNAQELYVVNLADNWIVEFKPGTRFISSAGYVSTVIDSGLRGVQWHKFILDTEIADKVNDAVEVSYYASDAADRTPTEGQWIQVSFPNPRDALLFDARGRYLWFRLVLKSRNNLSTPRVRSITAYLPRLSYLRFLPAIYQEDNASKEFLERFLSLYETFFTQIEEFSFTRYIDPKAAPEGFLPWLGSWLALAYDENWPKKTFRKLLEMAPQLFRMRGTRDGLERLLLLYLEKLDQTTSCELADISPGFTKGEYKLMIFENFQFHSVENNVEYERLFCNDPYTFCVLLNPRIVGNRGYNVIKRIIELEKPAHTVANVTLLQPWFYLGMHTYLGINTQLNEPQFSVGKSAISRDTTLKTQDASGQIDLSARLGIDTRIS